MEHLRRSEGQRDVPSKHMIRETHFSHPPNPRQWLSQSDPEFRTPKVFHTHCRTNQGKHGTLRGPKALVRAERRRCSILTAGTSPTQAGLCHRSVIDSLSCRPVVRAALSRGRLGTTAACPWLFRFDPGQPDRDCFQSETHFAGLSLDRPCPVLT